MAKRRNRKAFTIVELVIVIAVIAVLATVLVPTFGDMIEKANDSKAMQAAKNAYTEYLVNNNGETQEYMLYEADDRWVALHNGASVGVYGSKEEATSALLNGTTEKAFWVQTKEPNLFLCSLNNPFEGKKLSVLGDSISTYANISNNVQYNSTLVSEASGNVCYGPGGSRESYGLTLSDTWWQQVIDALDMELCVANSIGGGTVYYDRGVPRRGAYRYRCVNLHNDYTMEKPDIIAIYLGTNDLSFVKSGNCSIGKAADIDYEALKDSEYEPTTISEAYALILHKISQEYPNAAVYCFTIIVRSGFNNTMIESLNTEIKEIANHFGAGVVDIYGTGDITMTDLPDGIHPNAKGMDVISDTFIKAILGQNTTTHNITHHLNGVTLDVNDTMVIGGRRYRSKLVSENNDIDSVSVTMGGVDITQSCYSDGWIDIPDVTGDIVITAQAPIENTTHYWNVQGNKVIYTDKNGETKTLSEDGLHKYYTLEEDIVLSPDKAWAVEWTATHTSSHMMLLYTKDSSAGDETYLFISPGKNHISIGNITGGKAHNYGVTLNNTMATKRTYRLENRIANDGTNMVWLIVDGIEIGEMNNYYSSTVDQKTKDDWISGKTFRFPMLGATKSGFGLNFTFEYVAIWEDGLSA